MKRNEYNLPLNDELAHHGILGQKWGKRNGPPYPLDDENHSATEKKAEAEKKRKHSEKSEGLKLTDGQKKAMIAGAAVVATGLALYGAYELGVFDDVPIPKGLDLLGESTDIVERSTIPVTERIEQVYRDAKEVNPDDNHSNCGPIAAAMTFRRLGFTKATAKNISVKPNDLIKAFPGREWIAVDPKLNLNETYASMHKQMVDAGDGHYGIFYGNGKRGKAGHYIFWENVQDKIMFSESQSQTSSVVGLLKSFIYNDKTNGIVFDINTNGGFDIRDNAIRKGLDFNTLTFTDLTGANVDTENAKRFLNI